MNNLGKGKLGEKSLQREKPLYCCYLSATFYYFFKLFLYSSHSFSENLNSKHFPNYSCYIIASVHGVDE